MNRTIFDESHEMFRSAYRAFVDREMVPRAEEWSDAGIVTRDVWESAGAAGFLAFEIPESHGGPGADDFRYNLIVAEELAAAGVLAAGAGFTLHNDITLPYFLKYCTDEQKERWLPGIASGELICAVAMTEPGMGSDLASMATTAIADGDTYIVNGSKTFITNGPYADTIVFICKLDEGNDPKDRKVLSFVLDRGMPGLEQSKPLRKMGMHSSPTGELFLTDVRVGRDRLIGETEDVSKGGRDGAKATFQQERSGVAAMSLGIIEQCLEVCVAYAKERVQFGQRIGDFQLIQQKLAKMEVARMNVQNLVFRTIELSKAGKTMTFAEASAMKLYSAQIATEVALEAVQLHGGNGYMAEFQVEQLARDAKVLQIYAGTDEIQTVAIAKALLA